MKSYIVFDEQSGEIETWGSCSDEDFQLQKRLNKGLMEGNANSLTHYVHANVLIAYTSEQTKEKLHSPGPFYVWSNQSFSWIDTRTFDQKYQDAANEAISKRNELLYASDWTQIPNNPLTKEKQSEWSLYRQQLRDITTQTGYPFNVVWPNKPE